MLVCNFRMLRKNEGIRVFIKGGKATDTTQPVCHSMVVLNVCSWSSSGTWEFARHANSWAPAQTYWIRSSPSLLGGSDAAKAWAPLSGWWRAWTLELHRGTAVTCQLLGVWVSHTLGASVPSSWGLLTGLVWGLINLTHGKHLEQLLAHGTAHASNHNKVSDQ